jgi:type II secretory pathway pseudopilin PulG
MKSRDAHPGSHSRGCVRCVRCAVAARRERGEDGLTIIEVVFVLVILAILLGITMPIVSTLLQTTSRVDVTYTNVNEQLWLTTSFQRLLRAAVAPNPTHCPVTSSCTSPATGTRTPFELGALTPTSMTFFADTGTTNGPVKIIATCTKTTTDTTLCEPTATFRVKMVSPKATTCPTTTASAKTCTYAKPSWSRYLVSLAHITDGQDGVPLFVYAYGAQPAAGQPMKITTVCETKSASQPTGCTSTDTATFVSTKCTRSTVSTNPFAKCPTGEIEQVAYDLQINGRVTKKTKKKSTAQYGGEQTEDATGTFVLSPTSMLFNPVVK